MSQNHSHPCPHEPRYAVLDMVQIGETGGLSGLVEVKNVRSVLCLYKAEDSRERPGNNRRGGDGNLDDITGCVHESGRRNVLWKERS